MNPVIFSVVGSTIGVAETVIEHNRKRGRKDMNEGKAKQEMQGPRAVSEEDLKYKSTSLLRHRRKIHISLKDDTF